MSRTLIVTDSCADLTYDRLADSVMVVPFMYHSTQDGNPRRDNKYYTDDCSSTDIISKGVRYSDVMNILNYALENDLDVLMLYSSSEINKCNEAEFLLAFEDYKKILIEKGKKLRCNAYDTGLFSQALGILINNLVELEQKGYSFDQLITYLKMNIHLYSLDFISYNVENLIQDKSFISKLMERKKLSKSILTINGGRVVSHRKCKSNEDRIKVLVDKFKTDVDLRYPVSIVYTDEALANKVYREINGYTYDLDVVESSLVVSSVIGDNSVGIAYKKKVK